MSNVFNPINAPFYAAVGEARIYAGKQFAEEGADLNSGIFPARFPFIFVVELNEDGAVAPIRQKLLAAAFSDEFRSRTENAIKIFYANHGGGTVHSYLLDMVDDFLNYALPRTGGLTDGDVLFDEAYRQFETDLFGDNYKLTVIALLENVSDHGGAFHPTAGLHFAWADCFPGVNFNTSFLRKRAVPFLEIKKACHPTPTNRDGTDKNHFFMLTFEETRKKGKDELARAYERSEEITRKTVLAMRLLTSAAVYAEYRGFRALGHYAGHGMILMHYPDQQIDQGFGQDLQSCSRGLERLFPPLLATSADGIAVMDIKIDDAYRRQRRGAHFAEAKTKATIDRLLDYCQILEAIVQARGSYEIALYAAVLLRSAYGATDSAASDVFDLIKDMYTLRNHVMHGRIDTVLKARANTKYKFTAIELFSSYVRQLAILYLLNPNEKGEHDLRALAHRLALGEAVVLKTL